MKLFGELAGVSLMPAARFRIAALAVVAAFWPSLSLGASNVYVTDGCAKYQQPEIVFETGEGIPEVDAAHFKSTLEEMVASGSRFKAGETFQVAWMILKFAEADQGRLKLMEPDLKGMPIQYVDGVNRTLRIMRAQRDTADSFGLAGQMKLTTLMDVILVPEHPASIEMVQLHRESPKGHMSGWVLLEAGQEPPDFRPMSMYELFLSRPDLVKFFALPPGIDVIVIPTGEVSVYQDGKPLTAEAGSFIDMLNRTAAERGK